MPELPEAETIVRDLRDRISGATVRSARIVHADILGPGLDAVRLDRLLAGRRILAVGRRAKNVVLTFEGDLRLVINLGMTGRLVVSDSPRAGEMRHIAAAFDLEDGRAILFDDTRRFGRLDLHDAEGWRERDSALGIEPLSEGFTADHLYRSTRTSRTPIRNWLLDQRRVAGIGNIYASEALFRASIRPDRFTRSLSEPEAAGLRDALRDVLRAAIEARGTTLSDYRDASGEAGGFEPLLRVYGRAGQPCPRCGTTIQRIVMSNRSAFFCPACQR